MTYRVRSSGGSSPRFATHDISVVGLNPPAYGFAPYTVTSPASPVLDYVETRDHVTPNARKIISSGGIINNPFYRFSAQSSNYSGFVDHQQVPGNPVSDGGNSGYHAIRAKRTGDLLSVYFGIHELGVDPLQFANFPIFGEASARAKATNNMLAGIHRNHSLSLVTAFESKKSVQMLLDRTRKLKDYVLAARTGKAAVMKALVGTSPAKRLAPLPKRFVVWDPKGNPIINSRGRADRRYGYAWSKRGAEPTDKIHRVWLEGRYGWGPLVKDIFDSLKALYADDLRNELLPRERFHSRQDETANLSSSSVLPRTGVGNADWTWQRDVNHEVRIRAYALYEVVNSGGLLHRMNDFGLFDIPSTVYELIPLSFVLDWIIPLGDMVAAMRPLVGVNVLAAGVVTKRELSIKRKCLTYSPYGAGTSDYWPVPRCPIGAEDKVTLRETNRVVGLPTPVFPPASISLSSKRIVDALALLKAAHRR